MGFHISRSSLGQCHGNGALEICKGHKSRSPEEDCHRNRAWVRCLGYHKSRSAAEACRGNGALGVCRGTLQV